MDNKIDILIVDDEKDYCDVMEMIFSSHGYYVESCNDGVEALEKMALRHFDLVLTDLMMPNMDGTELLNRIKQQYANTEVIMMTAYGTIEKAVETMKQGAYTYITKGDNPENLIAEIEILKIMKNGGADKVISNECDGLDFMLNTNSAKFQMVLDMAQKAAKSNANILILGESGVGKEVMARYIHEKSTRCRMGFVDLNCHSIPETVLESELFGHEKGSFTGATGKRIGRIENANLGTLFLDEIGGVSLSMQTKLLKVIENKTISRVGSNEEICVDFRLITATNNNLEEDIRQEKFREDLFYRVSTIVIKVPPLRERKEDLPLLIDYFLKESQQEMGIEELNISPYLMQGLIDYEYPGNIRELKNIIDRLVIFSENGEAQLDRDFFSKESNELKVNNDSVRTLRELRKDLESKYIQSVMKDCENDMNKTSEILGITRRQLFNKLTEYGLKIEKTGNLLR